MQSDWWCLDESDKEFLDIPSEVRICIKGEPYPNQPENAIYDPLIRKSLMDRFHGVRNEYLCEVLSTLGYADVSVMGQVDSLLPCLCCGYETLSRRGEYDICPVCFWEDVGRVDLDHFVGVNQSTLREARANFERIGAATEGSRKVVDPNGPRKYVRHSTS